MEMRVPTTLKGVLLYSAVVAAIWVVIFYAASYLLSSEVSIQGMILGGAVFWVILSCFWYYYLVIRKDR